MEFYISRNKINLRKVNLGVIKPIVRDEWIATVENINQLTWMDDTDWGKEFYKNKSEKYLRKRACDYQFNLQKQSSDIVFTWNDGGYISVISEIKKLDFIFDFADMFEAKVYKLQKEIKRE